MRAIKRNIVLTNKSNKNSVMGLITFEKQSSQTKASLKLYNLNKETIMLGISCDNKQVFKQSLNSVVHNHDFMLSSDFDINSKIGVVIVEKANNNIVPVLWGSLNSNDEYKNIIVNSFFENTETNLNFSNTSNNYSSTNYHNTSTNYNNANNGSNINNHNSKNQNHALSDKKPAIDLDKLFDIEDGSALEDLISTSLKEKNDILDDESDKIKEDLKDGQIFYDLVSEQIQDLFNRFPTQQQLEDLIPNSKWIKVEYEDGTNPYVLGLIYEDTILKYICYGIEGEYSNIPPKNVESFSQWLPINTSNPYKEGFWIMYQDATTGDSVQINEMQ